MKNLNVKELMEGLNVGEVGEEITGYNSEYICDIVTEIANNNVDIYNSDLWNWAKDNEDWIEAAISNGLYSIESSNFDLIALFQAGQYQYYISDLYEHLDDIIKYFIYDLLDYEYISEELAEEIEYICNNVDNNKQLDEFIGELDELLKGFEE